MNLTSIENKNYLQVGVIGLGVGEQHIYGFNSHPNCKVTKICDIDKNKLLDVYSRHGDCYPTTNPTDIIKDSNIDIVSIASFDDCHSHQILDALDNNKHVFVEKPMCLLRNEYEDIAQKLKSKPNLSLSSNLILRKANRFKDLKERISKGELGLPYLYEASYDYGRIHKILNGWRGEINNYSVMHSGGIHLIDLMLWLSKKKIRKVSAIKSKLATLNTNFKYPDCIMANLEFEDGAIGNIIANFPSVTPHGHRLVIHGEKGTFHHGPLGSGYIFSRDPESKPELNKDEYPGVKKGDMLFSFVESILNLSPPEVTKEEVFDAMNVSLAIEESIKNNESVNVNYLSF